MPWPKALFVLAEVCFVLAAGVVAILKLLAAGVVAILARLATDSAALGRVCVGNISSLGRRRCVSWPQVSLAVLGPLAAGSSSLFVELLGVQHTKMAWPSD